MARGMLGRGRAGASLHSLLEGSIMSRVTSHTVSYATLGLVLAAAIAAACGSGGGGAGAKSSEDAGGPTTDSGGGSLGDGGSLLGTSTVT